MLKNKKYLIFTILISLVFSNKVFATCTQEQLDRFKEIADKFTVTHTYDDNNQNIIKLYNPYPEDYEYRIVFDEPGDYGIYFRRVNDNIYEAVGKIYEEYTVVVVSKIESCTDFLKTFTISPPPEDGYSSDPLCEGIEEFALCQENYNKPVTREEFESRVEAYKNSLNKENQNSQETNNDEEEESNEPVAPNEFLEFLKEHLITIIIASIILLIIIIVTIVLLIKRSIKRRRLE